MLKDIRGIRGNHAKTHHSPSNPSFIAIGKGRALSIEVLSLACIQIVDFGVSHHVTHSYDLHEFLFDSISSQILLGNSLQILILGSNTIQMIDRYIEDVLIVLKIYKNIFFVYQSFYPRGVRQLSFHHMVFSFVIFIIQIQLFLHIELIMSSDYTSFILLIHPVVHHTLPMCKFLE